ncbi:hypothetical protein PRZ48_012127 [Zasmidium cellare]|uniref:Uncharacterized protein n=1 Tax=Zasmidium cellare TaxID=395010 RepID=A0ABR0E4G2_ZASCE|nr:hypothetical protein PRZ48_012127 [Zasmidium cellare]
MESIINIFRTSLTVFGQQPLMWKLLATVGAIWTGNILANIGTFTWLHFLRRSSLARYKSKSSWALITGSSDGIGKAFAHELCHRGFNVVLHGRNEKKLENVRAEILNEHPAQEVRILLLDVAESAGDHARLDEAVDQLEDIDLKVLINNVGGVAKRLWIPLQDYSDDDARLFLDMNCRFQTELTRRLLPRFINGPSLIMNIGSFVSELPAPYISVFGGAKAFGKAWSRSLHFEMLAEGHDVEVLQVQVGMVSTPNEPRPESLFVPNALRMAQSSLDKVGCGRSVVFGYWPHQLHCSLLIDLPGLLRDRLLMRIVKGLKEQEERDLKS